MPTTGPNDHPDPNGEKIEEGIEGGEDGRCDFEQVLYVAQIVPPILLRGQRRKGVDQRGLSHHRANNNNCPHVWINAGPPLLLYVALLGQVSPSGTGVHMLSPKTSFMIWDRCSFGREEEDEEDDGDSSREKNNDKGTMTTTNNCSCHGWHNAEGRWNRNIIAIRRQWQWHGRMSRQIHPWPVIGQHHSRKEGCGLEMLSSGGDVDAATTTVQMKTGGSK
jgi:hypothetical protein